MSKCCLLPGSDLWKRLSLKRSLTIVSTFSLLSWCKISLQGNNVAVYPFLLHIFMPLANLWFIRLQGYFPILRTSFTDLYPLIRPPRRPLALNRERIVIPGFIRFPPTLAVFNFSHFIPLGDVHEIFPFIENETRRHFWHLSGTFTYAVNIFW
jgi:hypothetical protein